MYLLCVLLTSLQMTVSERLAWRHAAEFVKSVDKNFDTFVSLPCTAPLRTNKTATKLP